MIPNDLRLAAMRTGRAVKYICLLLLFCLPSAIDSLLEMLSK